MSEIKKDIRDKLLEKKIKNMLKKGTAIVSYPFGVVLTQASNPFIKDKRKQVSIKKLNKAYKHYLKN